MTTIPATVAALPDACGEELRARLDGHPIAVFLDYDGTLSPIVDRPEDAIITAEMRATVNALARRCPVCVVSGRDRPVVQQLLGLDDLIIAGSHGFDIRSPDGAIAATMADGHGELLAGVRGRLETGAAGIAGATVEPKAASVALHYRLVHEQDRWRAAELVDAVRVAYPDRLKVTPGKMVYEVQPAIDWDKGKAVLYLIEALGLGADVVPIYVGDDVTDEHAFAALRGRGNSVGVIVAGPDPADATRTTAADYRLDTVAEVGPFLDLLAR